jgi:hypothetical protein
MRYSCENHVRQSVKNEEGIEYELDKLKIINEKEWIKRRKEMLTNEQEKGK